MVERKKIAGGDGGTGAEAWGLGKRETKIACPLGNLHFSRTFLKLLWTSPKLSSGNGQMSHENVRSTTLARWASNQWNLLARRKIYLPQTVSDMVVLVEPCRGYCSLIWLYSATVCGSFLQRLLNPFTPKSDQFQISPAASPEISHHTVWRTWISIAFSDERWFYYQFSLHHPYISFQKVGRMYFLNLEVKGLRESHDVKLFPLVRGEIFGTRVDAKSSARSGEPGVTLWRAMSGTGLVRSSVALATLKLVKAWVQHGNEAKFVILP